MITIHPDSDRVTLINVFSCEPKFQYDLVKAWRDATEIELGGLLGSLIGDGCRALIAPPRR